MFTASKGRVFLDGRKTCLNLVKITACLRLPPVQGGIVGNGLIIRFSGLGQAKLKSHRTQRLAG